MQGKLIQFKNFKILTIYRREDDSPRGSASNDPAFKSKRRSKKDNEGRNFKCDKCDKTYLSYPALYTHTKLKHSDGNDGKPVLPVFSGRGRGRPRKNVSNPYILRINQSVV